jgi:hypothetical protein
MEQCENCGGPIGKLETPMLFNDHVVCAKCHATLSAPPAVQALQYQPTPAPPPKKRRKSFTLQASKSRPLMKAGMLLMIVSLPLFCLFPPAAGLIVVVGLIITIVGMFT